MRRILNINLRLKPYKKQVFHGLNQKKIDARKERCAILLGRFGNRKFRRVIFLNEKLFMVRQYHNAQNVRVYGLSFEDIPEHLRTVQKFQSASAVMVWAAISYNGKLPLVFIDRGVKINTEYYQQEDLEAHLKPEASQLHPKGD